MTRTIRALILISPVLLAGCLASSGDRNAQATPEWTREVPPAPVALAVFKEKREIVVLRQGVPRETVPVRLGRAPEGHKRRQGDNRTPEGIYRVCQVKASKYRSFLWITYPNREDAKQALRDGRLSRDEYDRIIASLDSGYCPPADTALGGLVGIHGDNEEPPRKYNWTQGCIATISNRDLDRLASLVKPGTPVAIFP